VKHSSRLVFVLFLICAGACADAAFAQSLPAGWTTSDIGAVGTAVGSASGTGNAFTVTGGGADIWGTADAFRFVYQTMSGDGTIVARVTSVQHVADWTKAAVMMRAALTSGSMQAMMLVSANKGLAFQRRVATNGLSTNTSGGSGYAPYWVKLTRAGNVFTAYKSTDGQTWTLVGSDTIAMPTTIYVGLAVTSHLAGTLATGTFDSVAVSGGSAPSITTNETIVVLRHGEKPSGGYGQITCQGLQRALALPPVLAGLFGTPQYIFAPNPIPQVVDSAGSFYYVRPLATIEPTAIRLGMPVNTQYGFTDIAGLQNELLSGTYASATVFVAWEHLEAQQFVQNVMNQFGGGVSVPSWPSDDYDSLYVLHLTNTGGSIAARFEHLYEGLNNLSTSCP
jgi:hypothetical protein